MLLTSDRCRGLKLRPASPGVPNGPYKAGFLPWSPGCRPAVRSENRVHLQPQSLLLERENCMGQNAMLCNKAFHDFSFMIDPT